MESLLVTAAATMAGRRSPTLSDRGRPSPPTTPIPTRIRIVASEVVAGTEDPRRRILEAQRAANAGVVDAPLRSKQRSDYDDDEEDEDGDAPEGGKVEEVKKLKPKKPKVSAAEAAAKIDVADLAAFLAEISVAMFAVLAMVLRWKPDFLISQLPILRDNSKYQGHDKLPVIVWMISQASIGDLSVGLYAWARNLLPIVSGNSVNPHSRDLVLQLVERILSAPKARPILVNGAIRKGERLIPPFAFEILMRATFPTSSARVKATERFELIYPTLKEVALAGSPGSKAVKQNSEHIFNFAIRAAGEVVFSRQS